MKIRSVALTAFTLVYFFNAHNARFAKADPAPGNKAARTEAHLVEIYGADVTARLKVAPESQKRPLMALGVSLDDHKFPKEYFFTLLDLIGTAPAEKKAALILNARNLLLKNYSPEIYMAEFTFNMKTGGSLVGPKFTDCQKQMAPQAGKNATALVLAAKDATSADEAYKAIIKRDMECMKGSEEGVVWCDDEKKANERICALATSSCGIFGSSIQSACQKKEAEKLAAEAKVHADKVAAQKQVIVTPPLRPAPVAPAKDNPAGGDPTTQNPK